MSDVSFITDGKGRWWRRERQPRCTATVFACRPCQGIADHEGDHWVYSERGWFWHTNSDGGGAMVPPDHNDYRAPVSMMELVPKLGDSVEVTDPAELVRLEARRYKPGESAFGPA